MYIMLHAVLIGIDRYKDEAIPRLSFAGADAQALASALSNIKEGERSVRLLLNEEATRENIMIAIGEDLHRAVEPGDTVLIYFAGHGSPERRGSRDRRSRYLIPHNTEYQRIYATGIDMESGVHNWFNRLADAKLVVLALDSCFSGAAGRSFTGPLLAKSPTLPGYRDDAQPISIQRLDLGRGRVLLCAADDDQAAREDSALGHGVFTYYFLDALRRPGERHTIDLGDIYKEVASAVALATDGEQEPVISQIRAFRPRLPRLL